MEPPLSTLYTVRPIEDVDHQQKLAKYVKQGGQLENKSSYCRFFLRGICIMKPEYCKFAHSFKQLKFDKEMLKNNNYPPHYNAKQTKQQRKMVLANKKQFNQAPLFILKNVRFYVLYQYQFSDRYQKSKRPIKSLDQISEDQKVRYRIREIMHREEWDQLIDWMEEEYPHADFSISMLSFIYACAGFDKPATRCRFGDFMKYMMHARNYSQVNIIVPPSLLEQIFMINKNKKETYLQQNIKDIEQIIVTPKIQAERKEKEQAFQARALPQELIKSFMCRYFMAGNCQLQPSECKYAHSILQLNYDEKQQFLPCYRQAVIPLEKRYNYFSLSQFTKYSKQFAQLSLQDLNYNQTLRKRARNQMHQELYGSFLTFLHQKYKKNIFQMGELQRYYQQIGFNHTNENKFPQFENYLWPLRYCSQEVTIVQNLKKRKKTIIYPIQSDEVLDEYYKGILKDCIEDELDRIREEDQILESSIRRSIYSRKRQNFLPFHHYIKLRNKTVQQLINSLLPEYTHRIFFETSSQNHKKIMQLTKKYIKKKKKYICSIDQIENHIKFESRQQLNVNKLINVRSIIQQTLIQTGKLVFFWPFDNNAYSIDPSQINTHIKMIEERRKKLEIQKKLQPENYCFEQRITIVDSQETFKIAADILIHSRYLGVDLEGRLSQKGYIDLIQVSSISPFHKQKNIFVFDMWLMKGKTEYELSSQLLKQLFEDEKIVKILHDCRQDSLALFYLLGIKLENVFDTSGMDIYIETIKNYEKNKGCAGGHMLKKVYDIKVPGLNTILDKWEAPKGINILKDSMKKIFSMENNRQFLQKRPIDPQFLEYSVRDVQDLIEVYENMKIHDTYHLQQFIGKLYSESYRNN